MEQAYVSEGTSIDKVRVVGVVVVVVIVVVVCAVVGVAVHEYLTRNA